MLFKKTFFIVLLLTCMSSNSFGQQDLNYLLIARNTGQKVLANNDTIRIFGFATSLGVQPTVPGPTIYANEGDSVHLDLWNVSQGAPHTIHLHGLDVDQANDGVPHLSFEVDHMAHGFYHFKAPHAGTYLYHCHVASTIHVQAGMYGLIIIKPSDGSNTTWNNGYAFTNDHSFFFTEIDTNWHVDSVLDHLHDTTNMIQPIPIPDYHPQFFLINGLSDQQLIANGVEVNTAVNQVDYLRFANIGNYGIRAILPAQLNTKIISSDGRPLPAMEVSDTVYVFPGERYDVLTEAGVEFTGQIKVEYLDLNSLSVKGTQVVPVNVSGFAALNEKVGNELKIQIVPNPMDKNTSVRIHLTAPSSLQVRIVNLNGQVMSQTLPQTYDAGNQLIQIGDDIRQPGTYIVECIIDGVIIVREKLVKL